MGNVGWTRRRALMGAVAFTAVPLGSWAQDAGAPLAPEVPVPARQSSPQVERMKADARAVARHVEAVGGDLFAANQDEFVVVMEGVAEMTLAPSAQGAPTASLMARVEAVVDLVGGSVTGRLYDVVVDQGDVPELVGMEIVLEGHMFDAGGGMFGAWLEAPSQEVGRTRPASRASMRADWSLAGGKAPRVAFGPLVGTVNIAGKPRTVIKGAAALQEPAPR